MKIILISESLGSGGAERQLVLLAQLLQSKGEDIEVATYYENQFYEDFLQDNHVKYRFINGCTSLFNRFINIRRLIKKRKPDWVISFLPGSNMTLCLVRMSLRFKLIVSERSYTKKVGLKTIIKSLLYLKSNFVVTNSFNETKRLGSLFPYLKNKIKTIVNIVDSQKFMPRDKSKDTDNQCTHIICVGRVIESKNTVNLLYAINILINKYNIKPTFRWVGSQDNIEYVSTIRNLIKELKLEDTFFLNNATKNIAYEYKKADAFCLPSILEGYPNAIIEAMSCELPIICSNVCENPYIVKEGINGFLFDPNDPNDIAKALYKLCILPQNERDIIGKTNREQIIRYNNESIFVESYLKLISQL